jgi:hypothetical protein
LNLIVGNTVPPCFARWKSLGKIKGTEVAMNLALKEFLSFLEKEDDADYGDFKREVDLHLRRLIEEMRPLTTEQALQFRRMREQLLWSNKFDIEEMRTTLREDVKHLEDFIPPEL